VPSQQTLLQQQSGESLPSHPYTDPSRPNHPVPVRMGHAPQQYGDQHQQKPSTLANLKAAAAGIHVCSLENRTPLGLVLMMNSGCRRGITWNIQ
jgi:hypothetical protein